jgi:hypothetical protein
MDQDICILLLTRYASPCIHILAPRGPSKPSVARLHLEVETSTKPPTTTMLLSHSATLLGAFASAVFASPAVQSQDVLRGDTAYKRLDLTHDLFAFHKNLTQIESISGNEKEVGEWLAHSLASQGYHVEKQVVAKDPLRFNVLAWPGSKRDAEVLISSHIDTVSDRR